MASSRHKGDMRTIKRGLFAAAACSLLFAAMATFIYAAHGLDESLSPFTTGFFRNGINLGVVLLVALYSKDLPVLFGDRRLSLWLRGVFGTISMFCYFAAIYYIGPGDAGFIYSGNGIFVAMLAPFVLRQKTSPMLWLAIFGALVGLFFLLSPRLTDISPYGRIIAITGAFFAAAAYLMIAKNRGSNKVTTVIFYLCFCGTIAHLLAMIWTKQSLPKTFNVWALLVAGGLCASFAQYFLTYAYQNAPAASVTAVSYLNPVFSLFFNIVFFTYQPTIWSLIGIVLVFTFGVMVPFLLVSK